MIVYSSILILLTHLLDVAGKSIALQDSCVVSKTSFFVIDNASLKTEDFILYEDTSEEECKHTCTHNRDQFNRSITCNSFTYDHSVFSCTVYKIKALPVGSGQIENYPGKRYFEKICFNHDLPSQCAQSQFNRVDQSVLVGYAVNMTLTDNVESCVAQCVQESDCKSAMYFYEDGECITNKESALTKPAGFTKEDDDHVVYFQNGCNTGAMSITTKFSGSETERPARKLELPDETVEEISKYPSKPLVNIQISETTPFSVEENFHLTKEDVYEENETRHQNDPEYEEESDEISENTDLTIESTNAPVITTEVPITTTNRRGQEKRIETLIQKKIKKNPKNFGSKTYEILKKQETVKQIKNDDDEEDTPIKHASSQEATETYFSEWSDWTSCTKSHERQVRRRHCLNLRKCLGALMQIQNCPVILQTSTPQNMASMKSVVSVDGEEYDEPMIVDNISVDPVPSMILPVLNEQMWGPWQGTCQQFASSQPCNSGSMIGFESRECIAKDPSQCKGPFFRYCTLSC